MQNKEKHIWNGKTLLAVFVLVLAVVGGAVALFLFGKMSAESKRFDFEGGDGYIISSVLTEDGVTSTRQYFADDATYRVARTDTIEFNNTSGETTQVGIDAFVHYNGGSIGMLKKVGILDFDSLSDTPNQVITYYNLLANDTLRSSPSGYVAELQGERTTFGSILVKVAENKFLIAAPELTIKVGDNAKLSEHFG